MDSPYIFVILIYTLGIVCNFLLKIFLCCVVCVCVFTHVFVLCDRPKNILDLLLKLATWYL